MACSNHKSVSEAVTPETVDFGLNKARRPTVSMKFCAGRRLRFWRTANAKKFQRRDQQKPSGFGLYKAHCLPALRSPGFCAGRRLRFWRTANAKKFQRRDQQKQSDFGLYKARCLPALRSPGFCAERRMRFWRTANAKNLSAARPGKQADFGSYRARDPCMVRCSPACRHPKNSPENT